MAKNKKGKSEKKEAVKKPEKAPVVSKEQGKAAREAGKKTTEVVDRSTGEKKDVSAAAFAAQKGEEKEFAAQEKEKEEADLKAPRTKLSLINKDEQEGVSKPSTIGGIDREGVDTTEKTFGEGVGDFISEFKTKVQFTPFATRDADGNLAVDKTAVAGAATGALIGGAGVIGLAGAVGGIANLVGGLAGVDTIATWAAVDNLASSIPFQLSSIDEGLELGSITPAQANGLIEEAEAQLDFAQEAVDTSTMLNPFLWPARGRYMAAVEVQRTSIELRKANILGLSAATEDEEV